MSAFEWREVATLTNGLELARPGLGGARKSGDRGRVPGLEDEITRAESRRLQLLSHISTNIVTIPEAKGKDGGARQGSAPAAEAVQEQAAKAPEPAPPARARAGAGAPHPPAPPAKAPPAQLE